MMTARSVMGLRGSALRGESVLGSIQSPKAVRMRGQKTKQFREIVGGMQAGRKVDSIRPIRLALSLLDPYSSFSIHTRSETPVGERSDRCQSGKRAISRYPMSE